MKMIATNLAPEAIGPYSQAIVVDHFIFTSGQIPLTPDGNLVQGGIEQQTEQVLKNLQAVLEEAGSSLQNVVKTTVFLKDMNDFPKMNEIYHEFFADHKPARSCIEVSLLPKDVYIEIEAIAVISKK